MPISRSPTASTGGGQALFIINSVNTYTGDTILNNANLGIIRDWNQ